MSSRGFQKEVIKDRGFSEVEITFNAAITPYTSGGNGRIPGILLMFTGTQYVYCPAS